MTDNVADIVRRAAKNFPAAAAVLGDGPPRFWADLDAAADVGAAELIAAGLQPGDRVVCRLPTGVAAAVALIAVIRADLVVVPSDPRRAELDGVLQRTSAAAVIGPDEGSVGVHHVPVATVAGWFGRSAAPVDPRRGGEDLAVLARAGRPGHVVMLSHRALLAAVDSIVAAPELAPRAEDRALLALPLFHLAGIVSAFLPAAAVGAALVVTEPPPVDPDLLADGAWARFADSVLAAVREHRVTLFPGAPALYRLLLRSPELESALGTVRLLTSAAAPLEQSDAAEILARTGKPVWEGYGVTESSSVVSSTLMSQASTDGSVGPPLPGVEVRIEPEDDATASADDDVELIDEDIVVSVDADSDPGRIAVRGRQLFSGYWPDGSGGPGPDGWFVTSDIGYLDADGELHLIDRKPETIVVAGFTVYPREVEAALLTHPDVRDAAVVGIPDERGTALVASVVTSAASDVSDADRGAQLDAHLESLLPAFKRPHRYRIVRILPRTEIGRLDRSAVIADWTEHLGLDVTEVPGARLSVVPGGQPAPAAEPEAEPAPLAEPPEIIEVSQLDSLGSRLPGVGARSRRSAEDTDSDLFGEEWLDPVDGETIKRP